MKKITTKATPLGGVFWNGGAETFIHKGTNGRWRDVLSAEECAAYDAKCAPSSARTRQMACG